MHKILKLKYIAAFIALLFVAFLSGIVLTVSADADLTIYDDQLADNWANWSWGTNVNFNSTTPVQDGDKAISVKYRQAWAGLFLHSNALLDPADYTTLSFAIHGDVAGGHDIRVALVDENNNYTEYVQISTVANQWNVIEIPLSDFSPAGMISGIVWQEFSGSGQPRFHVDNLVLLAEGSTPEPTPEPSPTTPPTNDDTMIYVDGMLNGWDHSSWGSAIDFDSTANPMAGSKSIAITYNQLWGAFYATNSTPLEIASNDNLEFWISGTGQNLQMIRVSLVDGRGIYAGASVVVEAEANQWNWVSIPMGDLGNPSSITGVVLQDDTGTAQSTFYIDDLMIMHTGTSEIPTPTSEPPTPTDEPPAPTETSVPPTPTDEPPAPTETSVPPSPTNEPPPSGDAGLVPWQGGEWFLSGVNVPWQNGGFGADFGTIEEWGQHTYSPAATDAMFAELAANGVNSVRWWVFTDGRGAPEFDSHSGGAVTGLDANFLPSIVDAVNKAEAHGIYITFVLWDHSMFRADGTASDRGEHAGGHHDLLQDNAKRQSFIDNALIPLLTAPVGVHTVGTHPNVMAFEVMNEPEYAVSDLGSVTGEIIPVSLNDMHSFVALVAGTVHRHSSALVTVGSAALKYNSDTVLGAYGNIWKDSIMHAYDPQGHLDFYSPHYYGWMDGDGTSWDYNPLHYINDLDKPTVIGEFAAIETGMLQGLLNNGYAGGWAWSYEGVDAAGSWNDIKNEMSAFNSTHSNIVCISCNGSTPPPTSTPAPTQTSVPPTPTNEPPAPTATSEPPAPTATSVPPTPEPSPTPPPANSSFSETFDGSPDNPLPFDSSRWNMVVNSRDVDTWYNLDPSQGHHGPNCEAPLATHTVTAYQDTIYQCKNHVMTTINAGGYGALYMTPNEMIDFSEEGVIRFDVSTLRTSGRDWIDVWVTPYDHNLSLPLQDWLPALSGEPKHGLQIQMQIDNFSEGLGVFKAFRIDNFQRQALPQASYQAWDAFLNGASDDIRARERHTVEIIVTKTSLKVWAPEFNLVWVDTTFAALGYDSGVVQFSQHSYNPTKACASCVSSTYHWDNIGISPTIPFSFIDANEFDAHPGNNATLTFPVSAPANAHLRFSGVGSNLELSFDGGNSWQAAQMAEQESYADQRWRSYWHPIPQGVSSVMFRGDGWYGGEFNVRYASIWTREANVASTNADAQFAAAEFDFGKTGRSRVNFEDLDLEPKTCHIPREDETLSRHAARPEEDDDTMMS